MLTGPAPDEGDRVHLEEQSRGAALVAHLGVEDMGRTYRELERLHLAGVLVQEEAEIRR